MSNAIFWIGLFIFLKCAILEPNVSQNLQSGEHKPVGFKAAKHGLWYEVQTSEVKLLFAFCFPSGFAPTAGKQGFLSGLLLALLFPEVLSFESSDFILVYLKSVLPIFCLGA